jgi:non-specific protein-tyrosine kinase
MANHSTDNPKTRKPMTEAPKPVASIKTKHDNVKQLPTVSVKLKPKSKKQPNAKQVTVKRSGWISPKYTKSRYAYLDPKVAETNRCVGLLPGNHESKHYKMLRTQIRQKMEANAWNSLMITSAHEAEGKTVTAINLAAMFAKEYAKTVLLVDADLGKQNIHKYLGYEQNHGLVEFLLGNVPMHDIIVWPGIEKLTIISGGRTLEEGAELLNSPRMRALLKQMKTRYANRFLIFDTPPLLGSADALTFAPLVDAILVVVEAGKTPMPDIEKAMAMLPPNKVLGVIMNRKS